MSDANYASGNSAANADGPNLSLADTLTGIFFEPGRVFESFRPRPRFLVALVITIAAVMVFQILFTQRLGYENIVRSRIESSMPDTDPAQREEIIAQQSGSVGKAISYLVPLFGITIVFLIGGGLYLLGTLAMGKTVNFKQALAVWTYSSLPPTLLVMLANIILLLIKAPEDIDIATSGRGLVRASPGILVDGAASPVLATALGSLDLFAIYGLILAALGLRKVARLSSGASWTVVIVVYLVGVLIKLGMAAAFKSPMA